MAQNDDSIIWAIKNGDLDQVKELIEQNGFDVNQEITTRSPIHYAADYGQSDVLKYLINKGADVNVCPNKKCKYTQTHKLAHDPSNIYGFFFCLHFRSLISMASVRYWPPFGKVCICRRSSTLMITNYRFEHVHSSFHRFQVMSNACQFYWRPGQIRREQHPTAQVS